MTKYLKRIVGRIYRKLFSILPTGKYIIFESVPDLGDSTKQVFDEMVRRGLNKKYKFVWWVQDKKNAKLPRVKNVRYADNSSAWNKRIFQYYRVRAKCFIFCNKLLNKDVKRTKSFYITHGTAIKSIKSYYHSPVDLDYCFISSPHFIDMMADQNSVAIDKIVALGYPRNDDFSRQPCDLHSVLNKNYDKVLVWYPTYRQHKNSKVQLSGDSLPIIHDSEKAKKLNNVLKEKKILIVIKPHFAQEISYVKDLHLSNVIFIDDEFFAAHGISSYQFVGSCDALLTDYSSIYFDYLLCDKPIGLVWEDIDSYRENPGFAIDLDYYMKAGTKIHNEDDLVRFIEALATGNDQLKAERAEISLLANYASDGKNTERVVNFIIDNAGL